jgi:hypothetical protein
LLGGEGKIVPCPFFAADNDGRLTSARNDRDDHDDHDGG